MSVIRLLKKIHFYVTEPHLTKDEETDMVNEILSDLKYLDEVSVLELFEILIRTMRDITVPRLSEADAIEIEQLNKRKLIHIKYLFGILVLVSSGILIIGGLIVIIIDLIVSILRDGNSILFDGFIADLIRYLLGT